MTWHPTDEDLILQFYGELRPAHGREVESHLDACELCRAARADLVDMLALADAATVPEPAASFERVMWARVQPALPSSSRRWWWLASAAGSAAIVILTAVAGATWQPGRTGDAAAEPPAAWNRGAEGVLLAALDEHFEQSEWLLVELMNAPAVGTVDLSLERAAADDLVASGRLYRSTARAAGEAQLADMLDDLETVFVDVARGSSPMPQVDLEALRGRIGDNDLLFKVRAAASRVRARQQHLITPSEGPL